MLDLSQHSDLDVLRIVGNERPQFVDIIAGEIDKGRTDEQIIRLACESGGSAQVMRYTQKCLRALRRLAALDALTAESQRLGLYEPNNGSARWVRSEYPHPNFPAAMRSMQLLPDIIWLRYHGTEVTGWEKSEPNTRSQPHAEDKA